jgi:hypothetical protein
MCCFVYPDDEISYFFGGSFILETILVIIPIYQTTPETILLKIPIYQTTQTKSTHMKQY